MDKELVVTAETSKKGAIGFHNMNQINDFFKKYPNKKFIVTFQILDKGSTDGLKSYFYAKVVPAWVKWYLDQGQVKTPIQVEMEIRNMCPISKVKPLSEMNYTEMVQFMNEVRIRTMEHINAWVECPSVL